MTRRFLSLALSLSLAAPVFAQAAKTAASTAPIPLTAKLPIDSKVKIGTLPNGIRYYIRKNLKPEKRAELRLVVNAGSVLENENQLGLAHFVEHTAFNGTTHFAKNDLVKYLQSIGVRFGADLNAYTGFDETVYILPVPTDTARIVEQAFTILEDWAHGQVFDSTEVTNERGVVREEWRLGKGAGDRMLHQWLPIALKGSLYAERLPIGNEQSIMTATPARLRSFYKSWYRPDLQAVIAVGDFDPAAIEAQIKKHFAGIPEAGESAQARAGDRSAQQGAADRDRVRQGSDRLGRRAHVQASGREDDDGRRLPPRPHGATVPRHAERPARRRLRKSRTRRSSAQAGRKAASSAARPTHSRSAPSVKDGGIDRGLEALLVEAKRVDQFGFLQTELDREKESLVRGYERAYAERDKTQSSALVQEYINNYLTGEAIPGIDYEYKLVQQLVPTITLARRQQDGEQLDHRRQSRDHRANRRRRTALRFRHAAELLAVFQRAEKAPVAAYTENLSTEALVDQRTPGRNDRGPTSIPAVNVTEWTLSNGARVLVKPTDFKADEVLFSAYSPGGSSLSSDADYMSASLASQIVGRGGLGKFNVTDLQKKLTGKVASASATIGETSEGLSGRASPKDIETMFQLDLSRLHGAATRHSRIPGVEESGGAVSRQSRRRSR